VLATLLLCGSLSAAEASAILTFTGTTPDTNVDVRFSAELTISGDILTIVLTNDSATIPASTLNPNDLLTSFYFDIQGGAGNRPTLTYVSATGDVYLGDKDNLDSVSTPGADLVADTAGDHTWQFKQGLSLPAGSTTLTFGIGTAGNSSLSPNGFNGNIVGGRDYGIYAGDITTQNLDGDLLVKTTATFVFSGVGGFTEDDISDTALFGLGTQPDSTGVVPEPLLGLLLGLGLLGVGLTRER
jgi:hypothetical protein